MIAQKVQFWHWPEMHQFNLGKDESLVCKKRRYKPELEQYSRDGLQSEWLAQAKRKENKYALLEAARVIEPDCSIMHRAGRKVQTKRQPCNFKMAETHTPSSWSSSSRCTFFGTYTDRGAMKRCWWCFIYEIGTLYQQDIMNPYDLCYMRPKICKFRSEKSYKMHIVCISRHIFACILNSSVQNHFSNIMWHEAK